MNTSTMSTSIVLGLSQPGDSEAETKIINALQGLVDGSLDPASAAQAIDKIIILDCQEAYDSYTAISNSTSEQVGDGTVRSPEPVGWMKFVWDCLGKAAMRIPTTHPGQDRLVRLLQELERLPRRSVPWLATGRLTEKQLWELTPATKYEGLEQWLWELDQGTFTGTRQAERDPTVGLKYINFSAFLARLLANGLVETTRLSALIRPSPFATPFSSFSKRYTDPGEAARHFEVYASAAAQWIIFAANALYEMCDKGVLADVGKQRWTRSLWNSWSSNFQAVTKEDHFSASARDHAAQAIRHMKQLEEHGTKDEGNIVQKFGFVLPEEDEDI
ncbi:hypothetical protein F4779DRAFT_575958, partial [Xylariaceae sp. FL0662B]